MIIRKSLDSLRSFGRCVDVANRFHDCAWLHEAELGSSSSTGSFSDFHSIRWYKCSNLTHSSCWSMILSRWQKNSRFLCDKILHFDLCFDGHKPSTAWKLFCNRSGRLGYTNSHTVGGMTVCRFSLWTYHCNGEVHVQCSYRKDRDRI